MCGYCLIAHHVSFIRCGKVCRLGKLGRNNTRLWTAWDVDYSGRPWEARGPCKQWRTDGPLACEANMWKDNSESSIVEVWAMAWNGNCSNCHTSKFSNELFYHIKEDWFHDSEIPWLMIILCYKSPSWVCQPATRDWSFMMCGLKSVKSKKLEQIAIVLLNLTMWRFLHIRVEICLRIIKSSCTRSWATAGDAEVEDIDSTCVRPTTTRVRRHGDRLLQGP